MSFAGVAAVDAPQERVLSPVWGWLAGPRCSHHDTPAVLCHSSHRPSPSGWAVGRGWSAVPSHSAGDSHPLRTSGAEAAPTLGLPDQHTPPEGGQYP